MRTYIYSVMTDERGGFAAAIVKGLLAAAAFFYGIGLKVVRTVKTARRKRLPCKVVSVGNLTLGGTGKTPAACMLAKLLKAEGRSPSVLIRGYGSDEWRMLEGLLAGIPVIVGRDRAASGREACGKHNSDTVILDDGFQHWALERDLEIVLVDSSDPFGNGRLFPRGVLREGAEGLKRADLIMLTKTDMAGAFDGLRGDLKRLAPGVPVLESVHRPVALYGLRDKRRLEPASLKGAKICCLSSIVNTRYFEYVLERLGARIGARFHFPDHHDYTARDLEGVFEECKRRGIDTIVTTEKDAVKLDGDCGACCEPPKAAKQSPRNDGVFPRNDGGLRVLVLQVELKITDGEKILRDRLHSLYSG